MRYYLKRCGHQELGSVVNGRAQRGRYLLTSKRALDFFPALSATQFNDSALLPIIPLYSGKKIYCSYVYHNDKFHSSTAANPRNEYRIYLNKSFENHTQLFQVGDIVIIRSDEITEEDETQTIFFLDLVQDRNSAIYRKLNEIIENSHIHGAYGIIEDGVIPEFENKVDSLRGKPYATSVVIDSSVTERIKDSKAISDLFKAVSFRDFVMVGYASLCAVTGTVICHGTSMNLEAAHIKPKSHGGSFMPNNGIALCRDLHWAFDKGFFTLTNDYKVRVHPQITSDWLRSFDGKEIYLPEEPFFRPAFNNIEYHRNNVYGLFLTAGKL